MRFTPKSDLPPSELIAELADVVSFCKEMIDGESPLGFDLETSNIDKKRGQDGLDAEVHFLCFANYKRRVAIPVSREHYKNFAPVVKMLEATQHRHLGFNIQYDWHALYGHQRFHLGLRNPILLTTARADGMKLFLHFDEEGSETERERSLKARSSSYLGFPQQKFDFIMKMGGILPAFKQAPAATLDYMTRDAWAHLGVGSLGEDITRSMPWCLECPKCGEPCINQVSKRTYECIEHGKFTGRNAKMLSIWDMHQRWDIPLLATLTKMQISGLPINWEALSALSDPLKRAVNEQRLIFNAEISAALVAIGGNPLDVNPGSSKQLAKFYHGKTDAEGNIIGIGLPVLTRTSSGNPSFKASELSKLSTKYNAPGIVALQRYKKISKILSTYVVGVLPRKFKYTGRLHGAFRPWTNTGRLLSWGPNMQNLPSGVLEVTLPPAIPDAPASVKEACALWGVSTEEAHEILQEPEYAEQIVVVDIRSTVEAGEGKVLICLDYDQLEVKLAAFLSNDADLIREINNGTDIHSYTASHGFKLPYEALWEVKSWSDEIYNVRLKAIIEIASSGVIEDWRFPVSKTLDKLTVEACQDFVSYTGINSCESEVQGVIAISTLQGRGLELFENAVSLVGKDDKFYKNKRSSAKRVIFGNLYGMGPTALAGILTEETGIHHSVSDAANLTKGILGEGGAFPGIGKQIDRWHWEIGAFGFVRTGMLRYRRPLGIDSGDPGIRASARRKAQNSPIQGTAADVINRCMLAISRDKELLERNCVLLSQVHDELLFEVPKAEAKWCLKRVKYHMETAHKLKTPVRLTVTGGIAKTWADAK